MPGHTGNLTHMPARAIWQGNLLVQKHVVAVKLYAAVSDRQVHFHLLHKRDRTRLQQRMVDTESKKPVNLDDTRKAFEAEAGLFIALTPEEIEATVPQASRDLRVSQFVPEQVIDPQFFDRPYYLGPTNQSEADYFALAQALEKTRRIGIANWVMRKHSYAGVCWLGGGT